MSSRFGVRRLEPGGDRFVAEGEAHGLVQCEVLTPRGVGAIAVVRVRGRGAWPLVRGCVRMQGAQMLPADPLDGRLYFGKFHDADDPIDDVIVAPRTDALHSLPCVDLSCHGGRRVVERVLVALRDAGAHVLDAASTAPSQTDWKGWIEHRADQCLARTTTTRGVRFLLHQRDRLVRRMGRIVAQFRRGDVNSGCSSLRRLVEASRGAHRFHEPAEVVLIGAPNVGKSSLANRLAGRDGALVADQAGTTRDWVSLPAAIAGVPLTLIDTAGHHCAGDDLEGLAIATGLARARSADATILVVDASAPGYGTAASHCVSAGRQPEGAARPVDLIAVNKIDLASSGDASRPTVIDGAQILRISAKTGCGMDALAAALLRCLGLNMNPARDCRAAIFDRSMRARLAEFVERRPGDPAALLAAITGAEAAG